MLDSAVGFSFHCFQLASPRRDCHKRRRLNQLKAKMVKTAAILFGLVFLVVGICGFFPNITTPMPDGDGGMLLNIFHVNLAHNIVHLASGAVFLLCGLAGAGPSRTFFRIFGIVYALVAALGFYYGDQPILGIVANNMPDVWLHVVLAVVMLFLGFGTSGGDTATA
jgi:hypothetical protein